MSMRQINVLNQKKKKEKEQKKIKQKTPTFY